MQRLAEEFRMPNEVRDGLLGSERRHCGVPVKGRGVTWPVSDDG
jgi:hypothetical protein